MLVFLCLLHYKNVEMCLKEIHLYIAIIVVRIRRTFGDDAGLIGKHTIVLHKLIYNKEFIRAKKTKYILATSIQWSKIQEIFLNNSNKSNTRIGFMRNLEILYHSNDY